MAGEGNQNELSAYAELFKPQTVGEILLPRLKAIDFNPLKWGCVSISVQDGKVAFIEVKETTRAD